MDTLAVYGHFILVLVLETTHRTEIGPEQSGLDHILGIERERDATEASANRSNGETFDVPVL